MIATLVGIACFIAGFLVGSAATMHLLTTYPEKAAKRFSDLAELARREASRAR